MKHRLVLALQVYGYGVIVAGVLGLFVPMHPPIGSVRTYDDAIDVLYPGEMASFELALPEGLRLAPFSMAADAQRVNAPGDLPRLPVPEQNERWLSQSQQDAIVRDLDEQLSRLPARERNDWLGAAAPTTTTTELVLSPQIVVRPMPGFTGWLLRVQYRMFGRWVVAAIDVLARLKP